MPRVPEKQIFQVSIIASGKELPHIEVEAADALEAQARAKYEIYSKLTGHTSLEIKVKLKQ